ncbi:hypothetical protein [Zoogloea sp.]|uniref:hypothetical protein n=1 Tax=Zoogloea sp. TaxID=49181 RepID=UPI002610CFCA|nr:hypothetical protein [Zoogloea sp.]MDD3354891.1 hypothetical protein [Zoogloea sp.]
MPIQERDGRAVPAGPGESADRQEREEGRNARRWSPEERRQLRQDVHEAGRDVYGLQPRGARHRRGE